MRKLILTNFQSPGDIVMLTAAVRDLHVSYPGQFLTDVRTPCPQLWENNPHITSLGSRDAGVETIDCQYPLIHRSNQEPWHFLHAFIDFLNRRLGLAITPTAFKGDIHISPLEKSWMSQVQEITQEPVPFWIVAAGGKFDYTVKWWDSARYQAVVDHFRGRILFVQVGELAHHHPRLEGALDLRGKTDLRQLVRLVYHSQGVLGPVTLLMHLAAAVEVAPGMPKNRPCVVVAGGREPPHWETYPHHQFIHTVGALRCCDNGGCWKSRAVPLGDGDEKDRPDNLCIDVIGTLPRCMDMITSEEVIRRIDQYFQGGAIQYLSTAQANISQEALVKTEAIQTRSTHQLFKPATFQEGMEMAVGACNGLTREKRWQMETPAFAREILPTLPPGAKTIRFDRPGFEDDSRQTSYRAPHDMSFKANPCSNISFIIAVRDEPDDLLQTTIDGLLRTSDGYRREIVLVDDCSFVPIQIERPDVLVVRNGAPIGSARSRRTGASFASGEVLSFLDPHMSFAPDWLDRMMAHVDSGALLCSAWWDYELIRCHCWGADFRWCDQRDYASGRCPGFDFRHRTVFPGDGAVEVPMLIGASYMMLRSSYDKIGGFSPFFRTWGRLEQDLSLRAWTAGVGVKCVTDARVGHFSRKKFPYKVCWEDIEFNQLSTVRTVFEEATSRRLEQLLQPPPRVKNWSNETDFDAWREFIQARRVITDRELFERFVPDLADGLMD